MPSEHHALSGYQSRLEWLVRELTRQLALPAADFPEASPVAWYMRQGFDLGFQRKDLEAALSGGPHLQRMATGLTDAEISQGKPVPEYPMGARVEVIVNAKNITWHQGVIRQIIWHSKDQQWYFWLEENGRKVSKRYAASDLRYWRESPNGAPA